MFLTLISIIISFGSIWASARGNISDPFVSFTFVVVAVVCAFMAGLNLRAALSYVDRWFDAKLEKTAVEIVESKMADAAEKYIYVHDGVLYQGEDAVKAREMFGEYEMDDPP